ncbi:MAG TPA: hypothetical protein VFT86_00055 [Gaiellaceae bacterium]|nr:hypothetical protein [Gaiellaceae bacterium]
MRSPGEDIAAISAAGVWKGPRDPVLAATSLLVTDGRQRHQPTRALHELAKAAERGDEEEIARLYARLRAEVESYVPEYPEVEGRLRTLAELSDAELEQA